MRTDRFLIEPCLLASRPPWARPRLRRGAARRSGPAGRSSFTLVELLVVLGIISILALVTIIALNPTELLRQSRDSTRMSDMALMSKAMGMFGSDRSDSSIGTSNTVYVSVPDPTATSTSGTNCATLGLPTLPSGYVYHCASPTTLKNMDGQGWLPVSFSSMSSGAPFGKLPTDPVNATSSHNYFTYTTNGSLYELTAAMESSKYKLGGAGDKVSTDGGTDMSLYEKGTSSSLEPLDYGDSSLVGYWTFDEGTGSTTYDYSGGNASGSWQGTLGSQWTTGKVGTGAGSFDGSGNYVNTGAGTAPSLVGSFSVLAWINLVSICDVMANCAIVGNIYSTYGGGPYGGFTFALRYGLLAIYVVDASNVATEFTSSVAPFTAGAWGFAAFTYNGTRYSLYANGNILASTTAVPGPAVGTNLFLGFSPYGMKYYPFKGLLDDIRFYNRALSASEISAIYNATK